MKKAPRRGPKRLTMHQVAKLIGVSPMTVSRVLSADPKVKAETRDRVKAAVEKIGYAPNTAARSLAGARVLRIGLLYGNPSVAYLNEMLVGIIEESSTIGCQIVLERCGPRGERAAIVKMINGGVDGVLLPPPLSDSGMLRERLRSANVPFVCVAGSRNGDPDLSVGIDNFEAAATMTRFLLALGHRKIAFIRGASNQHESGERYAGFEAALGEENLKPRADYMRQGTFTYRSGLLAAEGLLSTKDRPTAIFASNDDMAAAVVATAHRFHLEVPQDLTVVGFDDTLLATTISPALTTIHQPIAAMARKALEILVEDVRQRDHGNTDVPKKILFRYSLVKRESSSTPQPKVLGRKTENVLPSGGRFRPRPSKKCLDQM